MYPKHWGLSGTDKEIALINYRYSGVQAKLMIADVVSLTKYEAEITKNTILYENGQIDEYLYKSNILDIDKKFKKCTKREYKELSAKLDYEFRKITEKELDTILVELIIDKKEKELAALDFNLKYNEITLDEYNKEIATINGEPWFNWSLSYNSTDNSIDVKFDYNKFFVDKLKAEGHPGSTEEELIDNFIRDSGRKIATDELDDSEGDMGKDFGGTTDSTDTDLKEYK